MRSLGFILCGLLLRKLLIHSDAEFQLMREPTSIRVSMHLLLAVPSSHLLRKKEELKVGAYATDSVQSVAKQLSIWDRRVARV
jgi:hypothetical protein